MVFQGNYIDCSQARNATFELTLYADQPNPGTRDPYSGNLITGIEIEHTFSSQTTNFGENSKNITFGLYPSVTVDLRNLVAPMAIYDDGNHEFTSSVTI